MENENRIKKMIKNSGYKIGFIAETLGITRQALNNRLNGKSVWTVEDVKKLSSIINLDMSDIYSLFFKN